MDELERELKRLLRDDRWRVQPESDALDQVHKGAARRQRRRRTAAGGLSAVSVVALAVALATPLLGQSADETSAKGSGPSESAAPKATEAATPNSLKSGTGQPPRRRAPSTQATPGGPVPAKFQAASVTAMSPSDFWVLGTAPCDNRTCTSIVVTHDGGETFRGLPAPRAPLGTGRTGKNTVTELRFGSNEDGFAYGGALWTTHDGGGSWSRQKLRGKVVELEAAEGTVWALVERGDTQRLYRSPVSSDAWQRVALPVTLGDAPADLALQAGAVTVAGSAGDRAVSLVSTDGGGTFDVGDRPCDPALGTRLSAAGDTLWMFCATGTRGRTYVSTDSGLDWRPVRATPPGGWANSTTLGARGDGSAVLASGGDFYVLSASSRLRPLGDPPGTDAARYEFIGFTTEQVGYAVADEPTRSSLARTTDGGRTWSVVHPS